jgi:hypothetical protein
MSAWHPLPLPEAATRALHPLRHALADLKSGKRLVRSKAIGLLEGAITDLKLGLESEADAATGDPSGDLLRALGPSFTVGEMEGARSILKLMLAALPPEIKLGPRS